MASRILNRRLLREQADAVEGSQAITSDTALADVPTKKPAKAKKFSRSEGEKTAREKAAPPSARPLGCFRRDHETGRDLRL
jgi:hypothetical protein